jgi:hypothetical protein
MADGQRLTTSLIDPSELKQRLELVAQTLRGRGNDVAVVYDELAQVVYAMTTNYAQHSTRLRQWMSVDLINIAGPQAIQREYQRKRRKSRTIAVLQGMTATMVFMPVFITWLGIKSAVEAYYALLNREPQQMINPFLYMWQDGFNGNLWLTLSNTGMINACVLISVILSAVFLGISEHQQYKYDDVFIDEIVSVIVDTKLYIHATSMTKHTIFHNSVRDKLIAMRNHMKDFQINVNIELIDTTSINRIEDIVGQTDVLIRQQHELFTHILQQTQCICRSTAEIIHYSSNLTSPNTLPHSSNLTSPNMLPLLSRFISNITAGNNGITFFQDSITKLDRISDQMTNNTSIQWQTFPLNIQLKRVDLDRSNIKQYIDVLIVVRSAVCKYCELAAVIDYRDLYQHLPSQIEFFVQNNSRLTTLMHNVAKHVENTLIGLNVSLYARIMEDDHIIIDLIKNVNYSSFHLTMTDIELFDLNYTALADFQHSITPQNDIYSLIVTINQRIDEIYSSTGVISQFLSSLNSYRRNNHTFLKQLPRTPSIDTIVTNFSGTVQNISDVL